MQALDWPALQKIHDHFADAAIGICNSGDEVAHQLLAVRANSQGRIIKMTAVPPQMMSFFFRDDAGKDAFAAFMKDLLIEGSELRRSFVEGTGFEPNVLVQVNEAWMASPSPVEDISSEGLINGLRPSQHPNRKEVIAVTLHTRQGSVPVVHEIVSKPKRHAVRARFPSKSESVHYMGRFSMNDAFGPEENTKH